jgi:hypothetical protein
MTTLAGRRWSPLESEVNWRLDCRPGEICTVFGQFRDGAGNESLVVTQQIQLASPKIYLPMILSKY